MQTQMVGMDWGCTIHGGGFRSPLGPDAAGPNGGLGVRRWCPFLFNFFIWRLELEFSVKV